MSSTDNKYELPRLEMQVKELDKDLREQKSLSKEIFQTMNTLNSNMFELRKELEVFIATQRTETLQLTRRTDDLVTKTNTLQPATICTQKNKELFDKFNIHKNIFWSILLVIISTIIWILKMK